MVSSKEGLPGMRAQVERFDWAATPFGPVATWPASLRLVLDVMLDSPEPMVVWWGDEMRQIFNDAYAPRVEQPGRVSALAQPAAALWTEGWAAVEPDVKLVMAGKPPERRTDCLVRVERDGQIVDTYWNYSLTPLRDDAGAILGVLVLSNETTGQVLGVRRQATLDWLRHRLSAVDSREALDECVSLAAGFNPHDLHGLALVPATAAQSSVVDGARLYVTARDVGVDADLALAFGLSSRLPVDAAFRRFFEQFTLLVASTRHRIDSEAARRVVEAERDRLLLDAPVGAAVMVGPELVYHLVNPIYAMVSGRPASEMVGKPFVEVYPELEGSQVHLKFKQVYEAGEPYTESQPMLVQIHRNGGALDDRFFTFNLSPLRTLDGEVYGLMVIAVDVTVQVEARAEVEQLNVDLQAAAQAKDEFLALLGHELRNPLAPIVTALELMRIRDRSSDREQVIIRRQVSHLTRLVDDLLDVSRITRGKVELRKEALDVQEVLHRAIEMVAPMIEQKRQTLKVEVAALQWYGDPARLAQIVSNLLTNASRYSQPGARIEVAAGEVDGRFQIDVADNGNGIPDELLARIFEPFVQGERKLHGSVGGLGIGLALVKNLAEMHGGSVVARSPGAGQGSMFTVTLPLAAATGEAVREPHARHAALLDATSRSVIVVDDNIDAADTLADMLRAYGHRVTVAYTPETALEAFVNATIDLAVLDIGLPGITGYELADLMRESGHNSAVRFVALTGFGQQFDKDRSAAAGFAAHLVKPVDPGDIVAVA